jgi:enoyl-CoA hydratase/carnithine racemase
VNEKSLVITNCQPPIAVVTLNRPKVLNALCPALLCALRDAL